MSSIPRRSLMKASAVLLAGAALPAGGSGSAAVIPGFDQTATDYVSCQGITDMNPAGRVPNAIGNVFKSEIGLFRTREGGIARMMVCPAYGKYLEAGRVRGEIGGYDLTYAGTSEGSRIVAGLGARLKKYALPAGVAPGGHGGSHGYLMDDFIDAILRGRKPAVNVVEALNMTVPGYYAHLSALKDGETLAIPQYVL